MQARSALFDVYGDHLRERGGVAPVAALVRLLAALDIAAPAVRTAISRMVRQGWLSPLTIEGGPGYALTERAQRRLDEAAVRIYRTRAAGPWDGRWSLAVLPHTAERSRRERLGRALEYLGYRQLRPDVWIAPRPTPELESAVRAEDLEPATFLAEHVGDQHQVLQLWRLSELADRYRAWHRDAAALIGTSTTETDESAFATRSRLVHEWRKFLFADPGLPPELLPPDWPGEAAAAFFDEHAARLAPAAARFVDACLTRRDP